MYESIMCLHICIYENLPATINEPLTLSLPNYSNEQWSLIYKAVFLYNNMSDIFKTYSQKKVRKTSLQFYIP